METQTEFSFWGSDFELEENFEISVNYGKIPITRSPERIQKAIVCIILDGSTRVLIDGVKYTLKEGMILSVFPQQVIEQLGIGKNLKLMYFTSSQEILTRILFRFPPTFEFYLKEYPTYLLPEAMFVYDQKIIELLYEKFHETNNIAQTEIILSFLRVFYMEIFNKIHQKMKVSPVRQIRQHEVFRNFISLLDLEAKNSREVEHYAEKLNITPKYLSSITQQFSGEGAKRIIDNYIIMEVKLLLKSTNLTMQEISNSFNFADQAFFCKFFQKRTGYSPKQYRNL